MNRAVCPKEIPLQLLGSDFPPKIFLKVLLVETLGADTQKHSPLKLGHYHQCPMPNLSENGGDLQAFGRLTGLGHV